MRILLFHARKFSYKAREKAIDDADDLEREDIVSEYEGENVLVAFVTVEEKDAQFSQSEIERIVDDIADVALKLKVSSIVLYPYAHLSKKLAPPSEAKEVIEAVFKTLRRYENLKVVRAPFGWYKEFLLHCYGHPLAELSREYRPGEISVSAPEIRREYYVVEPNGSIYSPEEYIEKADEDLRSIIEKEALGKELGEIESPITRLCSKFGFEWEPFSDYGHMRYQPHATFILEAVSDYAWRLVRKLPFPVLKIRGTNMFDLAQKPVYEHARLFGDRLYSLEADKRKLVLRYAACHQQFAMLKDYVLSYKDLPLGMFEVADSYRLEQSGEVTLCFRLRKFLMPDLHILVRDIDEAMDVASILQKVIHEEAKKLGRRYTAVYNVTADFWEKSREKLVKLIERDGRPALVVVYPAGIYYWVVNVEYHIVDHAGRPREIATFQFDIGNASRFGIEYVDEKGEKRNPVIIHTALIGSVERYIYMVFDSALQAESRGETPSLPLWLAPIQVRIIPVKPDSYKQQEYANQVLELLDSNGIRVDLDDRNLNLGRRIRDAAREWIPYIVVIGDREVETGTINVTIRKTNDRIVVRPEELVRKIMEEIKGYPVLPSTLPLKVSQRPSLIYLEKQFGLSTAEGQS